MKFHWTVNLFLRSYVIIAVFPSFTRHFLVKTQKAIEMLSLNRAVPQKQNRKLDIFLMGFLLRFTRYYFVKRATVPNKTGSNARSRGRLYCHRHLMTSEATLL